jgi:hypothetical protein
MQRARAGEESVAALGDIGWGWEGGHGHCPWVIRYLLERDK